MMLGTFLQAFSQGYFPIGNFPNVQFPKRSLPKSVLAAVQRPLPVLAAALGPFLIVLM